MQTKNPLKELMIAAGYENFSETNRSYYCKAVNKLIEDGVVIEIVKRGYHKVNNVNGKHFNIKVTYAGWSTRLNIKEGVYTIAILRLIGQHLQIPQVREKIKAEVSLHTHCSRCQGQGRIPQFKHFCDGICFECFGSGMSKEKDLVETVK